MRPAVGPGRPPPSGEQHRITCGDAEVHVTEVGAGLRSYTVGGRHVLDGFGVEERSSDGRGQLLVPWPNRIKAGRYRYGGYDVQCPLTEPERQGAIHGLVRWMSWRVVDKSVASVTLGCVLRPQPGYEWSLQLRVRYLLDDHGLTVELSLVNVGPERAPFGAGFHPYLRVGSGTVDELLLEVPATHRLVGEPDGPLRPEAVAGTAWDFRRARKLGTAVLDTAYTGLVRTAGSRAVATLSEAGGPGAVGLWVDGQFGYLMVYTADRVDRPERRRRAVAVEPMTCPPQAFRSGVDVVGLEPDESWTGRWGLTPHLPA